MGQKGLELNPVDLDFVSLIKTLDPDIRDYLVAKLHNNSNRLIVACLAVIGVLSDENIIHNGTYTSALNARKIIEKAIMIGSIDDCFPKEICQL